MRSGASGTVWLTAERKAASGKSAEERPRLFLLEFDKRFEVFPEFVFYDFQKPLKLPREWVSFSIDKVNGQANADGETASMKGTIDHIICDPPFLSEDCQTKGMRSRLHSSK